MSIKNMACAKDKKGDRNHNFTEKSDGEGRKFVSCEKCGCMMMSTKKK